jgi:hypothetical protein
MNPSEELTPIGGIPLAEICTWRTFPAKRIIPDFSILVELHGEETHDEGLRRSSMCHLYARICCSAAIRASLVAGEL